MNTELEKQLAEAIKKGLEVAEKTGNFVIDQAPELLNEFYRYIIFDSIFDIFMSIIIFLIVRYAPMLYLSKTESKDPMSANISFFGRYGEFSGIITWVIFFIGSVFSFIAITSAIHTLIFISIAPKMYLIQYFIK